MYDFRKLIIRPSSLNVIDESPMFLQQTQGDIYGPIYSPCRPFHYLMVLIDASSKFSHIHLQSTHSITFTKLLTQIIN